MPSFEGPSLDPCGVALACVCPQLFFTDPAALRRAVTIDGMVHALSTAEIEVAESAGLADGMPFIPGADGRYDHHLNRFFRACPTMGVRAMNSLRAYARDILYGSLSRRARGR
jgi:hypothetical protein